MKRYRYLGSAENQLEARDASTGVRILELHTLREFLVAGDHERDVDGLIPVTYVIDVEGVLRIAPRRSEHVDCATGGEVFSAGEMFFSLEGPSPVLIEVSNHSAGYCPEPGSWPAVGAALDRIPVPHPGRFTIEVVFRRCPGCGQKNIVREDWFACAMCDAELPADWNF